HEAHTSLGAASLKKTLDFVLEFRHRGVAGLAPWIDDDCPLRAQLIQVKAYCFAHPPLDAVTHHGLSHGAWDSEADARSATFVLANTEGCKQRASVFGTLVVNSSEVSRSQQTDTFRKAKDGEATSRRSR